MTHEGRFAEIDESIDEMDRRLRTIARQNAGLAEMVEVLGRYVNVSIEALQQHAEDGHGGPAD
ncbi:hypothetical protein [Jatrophihabitans endophyticus]|uniref:hypothetical protein n=1 Tax=Jatrophihabitans endophyticus TaxID=1206085 RepID=UPI0019F3DA95|nr:hypothetical protein [Jatrophihabitans endophyticus]MBE7187724.1 hypothetical protein [Jatrophihabitans endophyticus]